MAKVIFYLDPIDSSKKREIEYSNVTLSHVLKDLKIENDELGAILNGENPEYFSLDYVLKDNDIVEIGRILHGSSGSKRGIAAVLQIVGLIVAVAFQQYWLTPYIVVGAALVSGALNYKANQMDLARLKGSSSNSESNIASNAYSLATSQNQVRRLSPISVVMGSHKVIPDVQTYPLNYIFGEANNYGSQEPYVDNLWRPGITQSNQADFGNWVVMPAGYIQTGFPKYQIKIAPYSFWPDASPIPAWRQTEILNEVKAKYLTTSSFRYDGSLLMSVNSQRFPLVIYHSDASDPFVGRYNLMHFIASLHFSPVSSDYYNQLNILFNGSTPSGGDMQYWIGDVGNNKRYAQIYPGENVYFYPPTIVVSDSIFNIITKLGTYLLNLNGGTYSSFPKPAGYPYAQLMVEIYGVTEVLTTGQKASEQRFNFGVGDFIISERSVSGFNPEPYEGTWSTIPCSYAEIEKNNGPDILDWSVQGESTTSTPVSDIELSNVDAGQSYIPGSSQSQSNWSIIRGNKNQGSLSLNISGILYATNSSGQFITNTCRIQMQSRTNPNGDWEDLFNNNQTVYTGIISVSNKNARTFTYKIVTRKTLTPTIDNPNPYLEVRIRKMTRDSVNNEGQLVCNLRCENICFYSENNLPNPENEKNAPMHIEMIRATSQVASASSSYVYSAHVEAKCWVYDFDTEVWVWSHTRNPAWWFLYFAHGGFKNLVAEGDLLYPYSPTYGWVNYPGHPDSTEKIFGAGLLNDEIDIEKILEWAQICDDEELNFDLVFNDDISCAETLEKIANCGRASSTYYNGKLSVAIEDKNQVPKCMFGMGNIIAGSFSVNYSVSDIPGKVICSYIDRDFAWETREVTALVPYQDESNIQDVKVNLIGITDRSRAQRECNILAARQFFQRRTYTWSADFEGLVARRGDLVYLSHDSTQYGFSGRIKRFIVESGVVTGFEVTAILDSAINHATIRLPNGEMNVYECHIDGNKIVFDEAYDIEKASFWISNDLDNPLTDFPNSIPEDFVFIAGARNTPGKLVRISEINSEDNMTFKITAVDEDPAMWAYEYETEELEDSESFDDSEVVLSLKNVNTTDLGSGLIKLNWESINGDFIQVINESTGLPLEANGAYSFTGGEVILELVPDQKYVLEIKPFAIGTPFKYVSKRLRVWPK